MNVSGTSCTIAAGAPRAGGGSAGPPLSHFRGSRGRPSWRPAVTPHVAATVGRERPPTPSSHPTGCLRAPKALIPRSLAGRADPPTEPRSQGAAVFSGGRETKRRERERRPQISKGRGSAHGPKQEGGKWREERRRRPSRQVPRTQEPRVSVPLGGLRFGLLPSFAPPEGPGPAGHVPCRSRATCRGRTGTGSGSLARSALGSSCRVVSWCRAVWWCLSPAWAPPAIFPPQARGGGVGRRGASRRAVGRGRDPRRSRAASASSASSQES